MPWTIASVPELVLDKDLLAQFLSVYAFQPATAFWRAVELPALIDLGVPSGSGIDIGCGDGKLTAILVGRIGERELVGVDPDPKESAEAQRRNLYTVVHTSGADHIPEPDGRFDFAISNSVLEHIPELDMVLAETARVLRRGGIFCLTVPHSGFHAQLRGPILPGITRAQYEARLDSRLAHVRYPSAAEWQAILDRHGFTTEIATYYLDRRQVRRWEAISRCTAGVLHALLGGRMHPVAIQRSFGLRQFQNRVALPRSIAAALSALITLGVPPSQSDLVEDTTGCVAIRCRKR
jgi:SAM-dependent methyltransferase